MKLGFLRPLYQQAGGYVSVYLDTSRAEENAAQAVGLRWRAARDRLAGAGADAATLDAAGAVITDPGQAAPGRAVFARAGEVLLAAALPGPPRREISRVAPLPHVMPLLAQQPPQPPHLRVTATRGGGDIVAVTGAGPVWEGGAGRTEWPVHKVPGGGWSQARYQRSAEEAWDENAKQLAARVTELAGQTGAQRIVIAGDARARALLLRHLGSPLQALASMIEQEIDAGSAAMAEAAEQALAKEEDQRCRERFDHWRSQLAHDAGVEGLPPTLTGLADCQVSELFLADRPNSAAAAWIGPAATDLAAAESDLRDRGVARPACERADAAIARAVAATDAELRFLPGDLAGEPPGGRDADATLPRDGICATLRYPPASG